MRGRAALVTLSVALTAGCLWSFRHPDTRELPRTGMPDSGTVVPTPVKAHLVDGSTVVFRGARITARTVTALGDPGSLYRLLADTVAERRRSVPLDSVVGLEVFEDRFLTGRSVGVSLAATGAGAIGTVALLKALFGSCPTLYADTGATAVLQAEGFSYAIAPRLEHRDVDPLTVRPDSAGVIRLELRNEALETHYINHVELLAVTPPAGARLVPDQQGRLVAALAPRPLGAAVDRAGRDVRAVLAQADGALFRSDSGVVARAHGGDLDDWIDLAANDLPRGDSVAVVLRLRNSLLNTVLLYEVMLGGPAAAAWLSEGLADPAAALGLAGWYFSRMGLRASVDGGAGRARLGDVGPIAFRDVAVVLPRPAPDARAVRVRLAFVADNWRIDRAEIAGTFERPVARHVRLAAVVAPTAGGRSVADTAARSALLAADQRYLETRPGQRMTLEFRDPSPAGTAATSYLVGWQGWYREWLRGEWLAATREPFVPGDSAVAEALARWRRGRAALETAFYATRIPVR